MVGKDHTANSKADITYCGQHAYLILLFANEVQLSEPIVYGTLMLKIYLVMTSDLAVASNTPTAILAIILVRYQHSLVVKTSQSRLSGIKWS